MMDCLSLQNHCKNKDQEIASMKLVINAVETCLDILECMSTYEVEDTSQNDEHLQALTEYSINGWPLTKA